MALRRALLAFAAVTAVVATGPADPDFEPATMAELAVALASANSPAAETAARPKPPPPPPPPPPSPAWSKFEAQYSAQLNASCAKVLKAAPDVSSADATAFMSAYVAFNGTQSEDLVFQAALAILKTPAVGAFLSGDADTDIVTCAVLTHATPAGLATFAVNATTHPALIAQLLGDTTLMRDMLVAGGPRTHLQGRVEVAPYGNAMLIYTQMLKASRYLSTSTASSVLADATAPASAPASAPAAATCVFHAGCGYAKGSRQVAPATTKEECCTLCASRGSCAAGVFDGASCWFKTAAEVAGGCQKAKPEFFGCVVPSIKPGPAPAPPPPPPPPPPPATCGAFKTAATCPLRCAWSKAGACTLPPVPPPVANPWDSRDQTSCLRRMALGTALEHATPLIGRWDGLVDPVARYLSFEGAYKAGDLDPAFEVLTVFEMRRVTAAQASDADLGWMRQTMNNYRPDHVTWGDYHWRYSESVHTEVAYGDPTWPDGRPSYRDIAAAGGVCGPRAWFGRFCKRAFGLPVWGAAQPGHAAMTSWAPEGWAVQLGAAWPFCTYGGRGGSDFHLEVQSREHRGEFQQVLRAGWLGDARGDEPVSLTWNMANPKSLGTGGLWNALALYAKKYSVVYVHNNTQAVRPIGPSVVPTKVDALIAKAKTKPVIPPVSTDAAGTITIPAVAYTWKNKSVSITTMPSADAGWQILHGGGGPTTEPLSTAWSYAVEAPADGTMYLTANITTWHMQTTLAVTVNADARVSVPVFYTVGWWNQTQPVAIKLAKGTNTLKFDRGHSGRELVFKEFFLYTAKPDVPPPPRNHTPTPPPPSPPSSDYIQLPPGTDCVHQGITNLNEYDCQQASYFFKLKDTGARRFATNVGCVAILGQYAGNANFNTNASAACCSMDLRSICIRK